MNETTTTKKTEFVLRRLGDSFDQFTGDLLAALPVWLAALVVLLFVARVVYRYANPASRDAVTHNATSAGVVGGGAFWLGVLGFLLIAVGFDRLSASGWDAGQTAGLALLTVLNTAFLGGVVALGAFRAYQSFTAPPRPDRDPLASRLAWASGAALATLVSVFLYRYYLRDADPDRAAGEAAYTAGVGTGNNVKWFAFTIGLFVLGCVFVALMYVKDTKTVRWYFALPLALLRMGVYALLCVVFLLPAEQTFEYTHKQSRVVVLLDISPSMTQVPDEVGSKPRTRMQILIEFLTDSQIAFMKGLLDNNPVAVYAFGTRLDESPDVLDLGASAWSKDEWEAFARYDFRPFLLRGLSDEGKEQLRKSPEWGFANAGEIAWARDLSKRHTESDVPKALGLAAPADAEQLKKNLVLLERRIAVAETIRAGTNVVDSVKAAVEREAANRVQGVVVFSDGRSTLGSESGFAELRERAAREKIPVFTVAVGEDRETVAIAITDVQAPDKAPVDEPSKIIVEADGVNLANQTVEVELEIFKGLPPSAEGALARIPEGAKFDVSLKAPLTFKPGDPPHGQVEFVLDPADPKLAPLVTDSTDAAIKKKVFVAGSYGARARIKKDDKEKFKDAFHVRDRAGINFVQQNLRVLLIASAPSREFAFIRTLMAREMQDKRATLTTYVQNEAGTTGKITPEGDEKLLTRLPNRYDLSKKPPADPADVGYNFNDYDVILAFDPDWSEMNAQQADDLARWVREGGGGLIYVAGAINTIQLARVEAGTGPLQPLLNVLPVAPEDILKATIRSSARTPRRLYLHPERILGSDLLKLDDKATDDPVAGWERFFTDRDKYARLTDVNPEGVPVELLPRRGFFSAYPVRVKPGSTVLADLADAAPNGEPLLLPWIVTNNPSSSYRTAFLASGELYKMRVYEPAAGTGREYFERFYVKLIKYISAKRGAKPSRGNVLVSKEGVSGTPLRVQARILNESAKPYTLGQIDPKFQVYQTPRDAGKAEPKLIGSFDMAAKTTPSGGFDGYYAGQVLLDEKQFPADGSDYRVVIDVPDSAGEKLTDTFNVRRSDPEMDNVRPDFPAMLRIASAFDTDFQSRLPTQLQAELGKILPKEGGVPRLAFRIADTPALKLIPACLPPKPPENQRSKGPVRDLWDKPLQFKVSETSDFEVRILNFDLTPDRARTGLWLLGVVSLVLLLARGVWAAVAEAMAERTRWWVGVAWAAVCGVTLLVGAGLVATDNADWLPWSLAAGMAGLSLLAFRSPWQSGLAILAIPLVGAVAAGIGLSYADFGGANVQTGFALLLGVTLLCIEWTSRKLLRLA